ARAARTEPDLNFSMGINSGPVYRVRDLNQAGAATGAGIKIAQQVASCGDAGHILASQAAADVLGELREWKERLHDIGLRKVNPAGAIHLFNLYDNQLGNSAIPRKLQKKRPLVLILAAAALLILVAAVALKLLWTSGAGTMPAATGLGPVSGTPRALSYSLTVQKYRDNKKDGAPFTLADANQIFESKYHVKLNVTTPEPGYFYVLNEGPAEAGSAPRYTMLYPPSADKASHAVTRVTTPEPPDDWFEFDNRRGTEKLWLVWSQKAVPELEAVKPLASQGGRIKDPARSAAVREMLTRYGA